MSKLITLLLSVLSFVPYSYGQSLSPASSISSHTHGNSTTISWVPTSFSNDLEYYNLTFERNNNGVWEHFHTVVIPVNQTNHTMSLTPYTEYKVCLQSYNDTVSSDMECIKFIVSSEAQHSVGNLMIEIINTTMVHAFWDYSEIEYRITLSNSTYNNSIQVNDNYVMLSSLNPNSNYQLTVCAVERLECRHPMSASWVMPSNNPPKPETPKVVLATANQLMVLFTAVSDVNGHISHYTIHADVHREDNIYHVIHHFDFQIERFSHNLTLDMGRFIELDNVTSYQFSIEAHNGVQLHTNSNTSDCSGLSTNDDIHCSPEHNQPKNTVRRKYGGEVLVLLIILATMVGGAVSILMYKVYVKTPERQVLWQPTASENNVSYEFNNPVFGINTETGIDNETVIDTNDFNTNHKTASTHYEDDDEYPEVFTDPNYVNENVPVNDSEYIDGYYNVDEL